MFDIVWPLVGAIVAGGLIGAEREFRSSPAGFRTHILVAFSSALLMLGAVHQIHWLTDTPGDIIRIDPVRMAHGVLTGIGFLCGGVIFREGLSVRGLTTAASLWSTSALGVMFGVGFYSLAIAAALLTLIVLAADNVAHRLLPQKRLAELTVRYRRADADCHAAITALLADHAFTATTVTETVDDDGYQMVMTASSKDDTRERGLIDALRRDDRILGFSFVRL